MCDDRFGGVGHWGSGGCAGCGWMEVANGKGGGGL